MTWSDPHTDIGTTGAYRQSWREPNLRETLARIILDDPSADESQLKVEFLNVVSANEQLTRAAIHYAFDNAYRSYLRGLNSVNAAQSVPLAAVNAAQPAPSQTAAQMRVEAEQRRSSLRMAIEGRIHVMLLDMLMPNGKPLRDNTREDLDEGIGWQQRVRDRLLPGQTVGEAGMTEEQLLEMA